MNRNKHFNVLLSILLVISFIGYAMIDAAAIEPSVFGDINGDSIVDISDLELIIEDYGFKNTDLEYPMDLDFNGNGIIDIYDIVWVAKNINTELTQEPNNPEPIQETNDTPILDFSIEEGAENVLISTNLVITVAEAVYNSEGECITEFDETHGYVNFLRGGKDNGTPIGFSGIFDPVTLEIIITPYEELAYDEIYYAALENGQLYYEDGRILQGRSATFRTEMNRE